MVKTPNLDRLAARGVRFENAQCNYPQCNPSRTSFLSGMRPERTRIFDNGTTPTAHRKDIVFMPQYFSRHGYHTARAGKIAHAIFEKEVTWDRVVGEEAAPFSWDAYTSAPFGSIPSGRTDNEELDGKNARAIVAELERSKASGKPFLVACGFFKPHDPFSVPAKYFDQYPVEQVPVPAEDPINDRSDMPGLSTRRTFPDPVLSREDRRRVIHAYYACVSFVDAQAGIVLDALDRLDLTSNTIVFFTSDHGYHLGEHGGFYRKNTLFEEAVRVPLIAAGPGIARGASVSKPADLLVIFPTLIELCGLPLNPLLDGRSAAPLLRKPRTAWNYIPVTTLARGKVVGHSMRTERYRYTEWPRDQGRELYDHEIDPQEHTNLAYDVAYKETVAELHDRLHQAVGERKQ